MIKKMSLDEATRELNKIIEERINRATIDIEYGKLIPQDIIKYYVLPLLDSEIVDN